MEIILPALAGVLVLGGAIAWRPLKRWVRKVRRRKGGVYGFRVRHHLQPARRVWGYIGETVSFYLRGKQHLGLSRFDPATGLPVQGRRGVGMVQVPAQPWSDLDPVMHLIIPLPWWLCWKWVLRPLETLVILCTWPVYNDAKNRWNPRRITKNVARIQRFQRDAGSVQYRVTVAAGRALRVALQLAGVVLVLGGLYGWTVTR